MHSLCMPDEIAHLDNSASGSSMHKDRPRCCVQSASLRLGRLQHCARCHDVSHHLNWQYYVREGDCRLKSTQGHIHLSSILW